MNILKKELSKTSSLALKKIKKEKMEKNKEEKKFINKLLKEGDLKENQLIEDLKTSASLGNRNYSISVQDWYKHDRHKMGLPDLNMYNLYLKAFELWGPDFAKRNKLKFIFLYKGTGNSKIIFKW